jgi:hypothetical protein
VNNRVSHPYKTTYNIIVLYILMYILDKKLKDTGFYTEFYTLSKTI